MKTAVNTYVIWRGNEDDYIVTLLKLDPLAFVSDASRLSNTEIVSMAFDVEYPEESFNPYLGDNPDSFELIEIFTGDNIVFRA